jgi:tRNA pseudouridine55 synthase
MTAAIQAAVAVAADETTIGSGGKTGDWLRGGIESLDHGLPIDHGLLLDCGLPLEHGLPPDPSLSPHQPLRLDPPLSSEPATDDATVAPPRASTAARLPTAGPQGLCGFLLLDKPAGLTSHACVARVRRSYGLRRVGHGGTLDPAVTGLLPIALGPATRLLPYLDGGKSYRGVIRLGLTTSSDDLEGEILSQSPLPSLDRQAIEQALAAFRGDILQRPPQVSAVHVDGERAYVRARRGEAMELALRPVSIERLELLAWDRERAELELAIDCSAGTYIRSLARDLGEQLGCGGALAQLRRTAALGFELDGAVPLEHLELDPLPPLLDPLAALHHLGRHALSEAELIAWRCGRALSDSEARPAEAAVAVVAPDGSLAGIARADGSGLLQPRLVFAAAG